MMTTRQLQDEILRLKKEKDICILAHAYQSHEILEVADYTGDSYGLSQQAAKAPQKNVLMCGVRFMAETVKILSPEKKVYLSNSGAGCPMAEQLDVEMLSALKESNPDYTVVAYINTTSELKTICDVCVTSSSALKIVNNIDNDKIVGAYAVAIMGNGEKIAEVMTMAQIKTAWKQGYGYKETGNGVHQKFADQMAMKTVKNRLLKAINNTHSGFGKEDDYEEISHDEMLEQDVAYDIEQNANTVDFDEDNIIDVEPTDTADKQSEELPPFMQSEES